MEKERKGGGGGGGGGGGRLPSILEASPNNFISLLACCDRSTVLISISRGWGEYKCEVLHSVDDLLPWFC